MHASRLFLPAVLAALLAPALPAAADVVFLKGGQRIEGEVEQKDSSLVLKTEFATLTIPKEDVAKIVRDVVAFMAEAETLHLQARKMFEEALKIENDNKAANAKLKDAVELLKKAAGLYNEARETYTGDKYADLDKAAVKLFQEMRIYRDKMHSEIAALPPPKPAPEPEPVPEAPPEPVPTAPQFDLAALQARAGAGDVEAAYALGAHFDREDWNAAEARKWYRFAADKEHAGALCRLGSIFLAGRGVKQDFKEASGLFDRAQVAGSAAAQVYLGRLHFEGRGTPRDMKKADEWCEKAFPKLRPQAEAGDPEALSTLGWMLLEGMGVPQSEEKALECLRKAAGQGFAPALNQLGDLCLEGKGTVKDRGAAREWYRQAAGQGDAEAQCSLGMMNGRHDPLFNRKGGDVDDKQAVEWLTRAAAQEHSGALYHLASYYRDGKAVAKDPAEGARMLQQALQTATDRTLALILNDLGNVYKQGMGVKADAREMLKYYRWAADMGDALGRYNMGIFHRERNEHKEAVKWWVLSAGQGNMLAQNNLAAYFAMGKGVKKDLDEAEKWFLMAAQQGNAQAVENLKRLQKEREAERPRKK